MICKICNKKLRNITNTHLAKHGISVQEYKEKFNIERVVDMDLAMSRADYSRGKSYEERYSKETATRMREIRRIKATHQMTNYEQIQIRRKKCGNYKNPKQRNRRIKAAVNKPETKNKRKLAMRKLFEQGYMTSSFSKPAYEYIIKYLDDNNISRDKCYYLRGPKNKEYFTTINGRYYFYDLVIFDDNNELDTIMEINGPWHYTKEEVLKDPWSKCTPYKKETVTKYQSYVKDQIKLKRAKELAKRVFVYWLNNSKLEVLK